MKLTSTKGICTLECRHAELSAFASFASDDEARINICGILVDAKERVVVSTDGYRMFVGDVGVHDDKGAGDQSPVDSRAILPPKIVAAALKAAAKDDAIVIVWSPQKDKPPKVEITIGFTTMRGDGLVAKFPPWRAALQSGKPSPCVALNPDYIAEGCSALRSILGKRHAVEFWLGFHSDNKDSVTMLQAYDPNVKGGRWRYAVMPMTTGEIPIAPWEDKKHALPDTPPMPKGSPQEQPSDVATASTKKKAPARTPKKSKKKTARKR